MNLWELKYTSKAGDSSITARFDGRYRVNMGDKLKLAMNDRVSYI